MKKLTNEQKLMIHGGSSIAGVVSGAATTIFALSVLFGIVSDWMMLMDEKKRSDYWDQQKIRESKTFINAIESKSTIVS